MSGEKLELIAFVTETADMVGQADWRYQLAIVGTLAIAARTAWVGIEIDPVPLMLLSAFQLVILAAQSSMLTRALAQSREILYRWRIDVDHIEALERENERLRRENR